MGSQIDKAVAEGFAFGVGVVLHVLRGDEGFEVALEAGEVAYLAGVFVVVDAGDLVVGDGYEPVLEDLQAVLFGGGGFVFGGFVVDHALPEGLALFQGDEHGVYYAFGDVCAS